jgi:ferric-dicitrate binding protein FerR (iron transport regulator)
MITRFFAFGYALILVLALVAPVAAQSTNMRGDWSAVQSLSPGEKIAVRLKDGDRLTGRFDSATDTNINFKHDGKQVTLTRESIGRVQINRGKSRVKGALVGAGIGGGVGTAAGGYLVARGAYVPALVGGSIVGVAVGATVGAVIGLGTNYDTIYEAR